MNRFDRFALAQYSRLVDMGMKPAKARQFVLTEQRERERRKADKAARRAFQHVKERASTMQAEAMERGQYISRREAVRKARR